MVINFLNSHATLSLSRRTLCHSLHIVTHMDVDKLPIIGAVH